MNAADDDEKLDRRHKKDDEYQEEDDEEEEDDDEEDDADDDDDDDEVDEEEPILKYARVTERLGGVYRAGDATSSSLVLGDKMFIGTHNGNIHIYSIPSFQLLQGYHAHGASVTALSVSPFRFLDRDSAAEAISDSRSPKPTTSQKTGQGAQRASLPPIRSNQIHIASCSIDGNVCIASLIDNKDVQVRNFGRPLNAVCLSPQYKTDRSYLSGGLAGKLTLTTGGKSGTSSATKSVGASSSGSGWLGALGLGTNDAKDVVLHSGEGAISTIKWSWTGRFVVWVNEKGIKILRSNVGLESADSDMAWKRIGHVDRPTGPGWEEMSAVWKSRVEWIDQEALDPEEEYHMNDHRRPGTTSQSKAQEIKSLAGDASRSRKPEKVVVGWGGTVWVIHIHPGRPGFGRDVGEKIQPRAEIVTLKRFDDCIVSGLSLLTPTMLAVLTYVVEDEAVEDRISANGSPNTDTSRSGKRNVPADHPGARRRFAVQPELRLIDLALPDEDAVLAADSLNVSRFNNLSPGDYHLSIVPRPQSQAATLTLRSRFEGMGGDLLMAGLRATQKFGSTMSVRSEEGTTETAGSGPGLRISESTEHSGTSQAGARLKSAPPIAVAPGPKIYIFSPYDCIVASKRDRRDHLQWLLDSERYPDAWQLLDENPELLSSSSQSSRASEPSTPPQRRVGHDADDSIATSPVSVTSHSVAEKEKRRIGEEWIKQRVKAGDWAGAGAVCGKVLGTSSRWEQWVWVFAQAAKFEEITPFIPVNQIQPRLPPLVYEYVLGHYITRDPVRLKELLHLWPAELFDVKTITDAISVRLRSGEVREDTVQGAERGRDWRILTEALAELLVADSKPREALFFYMRLRDADSVMKLIREYHLLDAVSDDIGRFLQLRLDTTSKRTASVVEVEETTSEAISLLTKDAIQGTVRPATVVRQLQDQGLGLLLFLYLRALWRTENESSTRDRTGTLGAREMSLVDDFGDTMVELFAEYDRPLLLQFLKQSQSYTFEKSCVVCERREYIPELVYLFSKTGDTKRALFLIIDKLEDVSQAISFAKSQDDVDLWDDLLDYSMDKPPFIRGLLEEVGTAIDPVKLVRRIPEGLEIEGLKNGISKMLKEFELQHSIGEGVAKILRSEVAHAMETSRARLNRGIKVDVGHRGQKGSHGKAGGSQLDAHGLSRHFRCDHCGKELPEYETDMLIGFACEHVFHLTCLRKLQVQKHPNLQSIDLASAAVDDGDGQGSRTVGAKVTRARILRDVFADGCPLSLHATQDAAR